MHIPDWTTEEKLTKDGHTMIIGIDEVGRGPLAGPVVACAAVIKVESLKLKVESEIQEENSKMWNLVRDSKSLSEKQREKVFNFILENFHIGIGQCNPDTIDDMNILQASFLAMKKAYGALSKKVHTFDTSIEVPIDASKKSNIILIDGDKEIPNFSQKQLAIPKGDKKIKTIAAASIIAKVTRDHLMEKYAKEYPVYGFEKHKGYGTKLHMEALHKYGASPIHRTSFRPVKEALDNRTINRELNSE